MARFIGEVRTRWMKHGGADRRMELLEDFVFQDDGGVLWTAPAGGVVDGASIPRFLWTTQGSPFVGDYRRASVIHDVYCVSRDRPHKAVHRMFYDAMICDGVPRGRATKMYTAVRLFGPRWTVGGAESGDAFLLADDDVLDIDALEALLDGALGE